MYSLINRHVETVVASIEPAGDVEPYVRMRQQLHAGDITQNTDFQRTYRNYWRLNVARLTKGYVAEYFRCLEELKGDPESATVEFVLKRLRGMPTHGTGRKSVQFSFATKLVHMIRPDLPIYDSMVQSFFFLPGPIAEEGYAAKRKRCIESYEFLRREYRRVMDEGLLAPAMALFRRRIILANHYTDVKVIDTLIWKFGTLVNRGAILKGTVRYA